MGKQNFSWKAVAATRYGIVAHFDNKTNIPKNEGKHPDSLSGRPNVTEQLFFLQFLLVFVGMKMSLLCGFEGSQSPPFNSVFKRSLICQSSKSDKAARNQNISI